MYDLLSIEDSNTFGAESTVLRNEPSHHQSMSLQKVINGERIEFQHELVCFISIPDLSDFIGVTKNTFSIDDCSHLIQRERIVFNRKG